MMSAWKDPWLADTPNFRLPGDPIAHPEIALVRDLMNADGKTWNQHKICSIFSPHISAKIINTPIFQEQDCLVWAPSTTGAFSVKTTYREIIQGRVSTPSSESRKLWSQVWKNPLHGRHKLWLWKLISGTLPTQDRLQEVLNLPNTECYLCHAGQESILHLLLFCPITCLIW